MAHISHKKPKNGISENYIAKIVKMNEKYILPSFDERHVKTMKYSDILEFLTKIIRVLVVSKRFIA
nr:hypothetical protein [uncultured Campylobacter sp.]